MFNPSQEVHTYNKWDSSSSSSESTVVLDTPANVLHTPKLLQTTMNRLDENSNDYARILTPNSSLFADAFPSNQFWIFIVIFFYENFFLQ